MIIDPFEFVENLIHRHQIRDKKGKEKALYVSKEDFK